MAPIIGEATASKAFLDFCAKQRSQGGRRTSQECAARAVCPTPFGNRDSNWLGTATGPNTITVTYTATAKDKYVAGSGSAPAAIGTATAKYVLTLHDEVERAGPDETENVTVEATLWDGDGTIVVWGEAPSGSRQVVKGTAHSTGWAFGGGLDVSPPAWKNITSINFGGEYNQSHDEYIEMQSTLSFAVPIDHFTYPKFRHTYVRHHIPFRHFTAAGEHEIGYGPSFPFHYFVKDVYSGQDIFWAEPVLGRGEGHQDAPTRDPDAPIPMPSPTY